MRKECHRGAVVKCSVASAELAEGNIALRKCLSLTDAPHSPCLSGDSPPGSAERYERPVDLQAASRDAEARQRPRYGEKDAR